MGNSYFEKIEGVKKKAFESAKKKQFKKKVHLSENQEDFAKKTVSLVQSSAFREFRKYLSGVQAGVLANPYKKNAQCERDSFEYVVGFNDGFSKGVVYANQLAEEIWKGYLTNLEANKGEDHENEKGKTQ